MRKTQSFDKLKQEAEKCLQQSERFNNEKAEFEQAAFSKVPVSYATVSTQWILQVILSYAAPYEIQHTDVYTCPRLLCIDVHCYYLKHWLLGLAFFFVPFPVDV